MYSGWCGGVRARCGARVGAERTSSAEGAILAGLRGEGRKPGRRRCRVLSGNEQTGVGGSFLVRRLNGNVGNAGEEEGEEERDK